MELYDLFIAPFKENDWLGITLAILSVALAIFALVLVVGLTFSFFDHVGRPKATGMATVVSKNHTPAYTSIILIYNGVTKTQNPTPIFHPEGWTLTLRLNKDIHHISTSKRKYASVQIGQTIAVQYTIGRYGGTVSITNI